jgi:ribonuclease HI
LTQFPQLVDVSLPDLWQHVNVPPAFNNTLAFFQHLLSSPPSAAQCEDLATTLVEGHLVACSDGACDAAPAVASHAVVLADGLLQHTLATCAGPVDGHPELVTSYRAELSGIVAFLYVLYRICQYYSISSGAAKLFCDNKGALQNAFRDPKAGIKPYFNTDYDLVLIAQSLIHILPVAISNEWVKGHYNGKNREYKHDLNDEADCLAGRYQLNQTPHYSIKRPLAPPGYKVPLLYDQSFLTSKIPQTLINSYHNADIEGYIIQKANWNLRVFDLIHWDAHERAFKGLPRFSQHSQAKLLHGLVNTNRQNHKLFGSTNLCPICQAQEETLQHVFTCPHPDAHTHRQKQLDAPYTTLEQVQTPAPVIDTISYGFDSWLQDPNAHVRAPTAASLRAPDAV